MTNRFTPDDVNCHGTHGAFGLHQMSLGMSALEQQEFKTGELHLMVSIAYTLYTISQTLLRIEASGA